MPSRVLRDGLLDSERVAGLHDKTFRLYVSLLLTADDFGLVPIDYGAIKKANGMQEWSRDMVAKMLGELTDAGMLFPYQSEGKQYAAIARWQSRVNCVRPKYPQPTFGMGHMLHPYQYKSEHVKNSTESYFKHLAVDGVPPVCHQRATSGTKGVRGKGEGVKEKPKTKTKASPSAPHGVEGQVWDDWVALRKAKRAAVTTTAVDGIRREAEKAGLSLDAVFRLCCQRGWAGFKAEWVSDRRGRPSEAELDALIESLEKA